MSEREFDSIGELAIIVTFIQTLSLVAQLPDVDQKKGRFFDSTYLGLESELRQLKSGVDLGDFAIPIDNLLEPGMARGALTRLDQYLLEKTGSKIGFLYQELVDDSVTDIYRLVEEQKAKGKKVKAEYQAPTGSEAPKSLIQQRRHKEKTRSAHSSVYEIIP
jgi:hypothetical protein